MKPACVALLFAACSPTVDVARVDGGALDGARDAASPPADSGARDLAGSTTCDPGYVEVNGSCVVAPFVDPASRSPSAVCAAWKQGHLLTDGNPWQPGAMQCAPGTLSRAGIDDTLRRSDLFRWLAGLAPVTDDATWDANDQLCAVMEAANGTLN